MRTFRIAAIAGVFALLPLVASAQPRAARPRAAAGAEGVEAAASNESDLTPQDEKMLAIARDTAEKITQVMEKWVKTNRITYQKLFSFLYFPIADTDPIKFHTEYDALADAEISPIQEAAVTRSPDLRFVILIDRNGYVPTHMKAYSKPLTGHKQIDLANNRTKRIFNDRTGQHAGRNTKPFLVQVYHRDTGELMKDLSVPLFVNGRHWGGVRLGYVPR